MKPYIVTLMLFCLLATLKTSAQISGIIVRPAGTNGPAILDPNLDGYTSQTSAGFDNDDILNSEILYKIVPPVIPEPAGDLLIGPSGKFTDCKKFRW